MTPEQLRILFDGWWVVGAMFLGFVIKYIPPKFVLGLSKLSNDSIGWMNVAVYILTHVISGLVGTAHAQGDSLSVVGSGAVGAPGIVQAIPGILSILIGSFTTSAWARTGYETLLRPFLEGWLRRKKVPSPPKIPSTPQGG